VHWMEWHKPEVTEQPVGLEVTTYLPAELEHD
jgi:coenzyme PQQ precursor peptide PqqA